MQKNNYLESKDFEAIQQSIFKNPNDIKLISNNHPMYTALCFLAVNKDGLTIKHIEDPSMDLVIASLKQNRQSFFFLSKKKQLEFLKFVVNEEILDLNNY